MHHGLNPPHDTRHDTRLSVLTEVDGSMVPLEELDDSTKRTRKVARGQFVVKLFDPITITKGSYLYPCSNMTPSRP
jgi:hypothetical protein